VTRTRFARRFAIVVAVLLSWAGPGRASTFIVDATADTVDVSPGDGACADASGHCTLRAAVMEANATSGADGIIFASGVGSGPITLAIAPDASPDDAGDGDLDITDDVLILNGNSAITVIIDGGGIDRVFDIRPDVSATLYGLTIRNGSTSGDGGGIANYGSLRLNTSTVSENTTTHTGGGVYSAGTDLTVEFSAISGNTGSGIAVAGGTAEIEFSTISGNTDSYGGGVENFAPVTIYRSTISGNTGGQQGGGIYSQSTLHLTESTVNDNYAFDGGGLHNGHCESGVCTNAVATILNSTFSGNQAGGDGGGIRNSGGFVLISSSTVDLNSAGTLYPGAGSGGGISNTGTMDVKNSIVANSTAGGDCAGSGSFTAHGSNFATDGTCSGFTVSTTAALNLGPLQINFVAPKTHALGAGSVAIDAVTDCTDVGLVAVARDQRGMGRPQGVRCDAGAFERSASVEWQPIGNPGNACDLQAQGCFGSVGQSYEMAQSEVTNAQYAELLNAVAKADPNGLYDTRMGSSAVGGIQRSGNSPLYAYTAIAGREAWPVNFVTFYDAIRYANWLHNGKPNGFQNGSTTEKGAYTITPQGVASNTIHRSLGALFAIATENEWYKAAYYDPATSTYFDYPASSSTATTCAAQGPAANTANCDGSVSTFLAAVGSYIGSPSPYGTLDQGGNVYEWNEAILSNGTSRGLRGGSFLNLQGDLAASWRTDYPPSGSEDIIGFRVVRLLPRHLVVGNPNAPDVTGYGAVSYTYRLAKTPVTNAEYAEFLNAVAQTDTYDLYHPNMGFGWGIARTGSSGSFVYSAEPGRADLPVTLVTFYDSLRFANWLANGKPTGAQGNATTEDGSYTITAQGIANNSITRNPQATVYVPSEDEWYKAAYYDPQSASYFDYPAGSDEETTCASPRSSPNTANCGNAVGDLTPVGSYWGSASPYGTYDQGGNVWEWNEAVVFGGRGFRGGSFDEDGTALAASFRGWAPAGAEDLARGFRVASRDLPEPDSGALGISGVLAVAGLARRRRRLS
jgi:CSLREA domain-containing protein